MKRFGKYTMERQLKKIYLAILLPAATGFVLVYAAKMLDIYQLPVARAHALMPPVLFILSAAFAVAAPTFYRAYFAHKHRHRSAVREEELVRMEGRSIAMVMVAPYLALLAYGLNLPRFHFCGTVIMGLYAVYYFYPSKKRLRFQKRLYRVKP